MVVRTFWLAAKFTRLSDGQAYNCRLAGAAEVPCHLNSSFARRFLTVFADDYTRRIGLATENEARLALYSFLVRRYREEWPYVDEAGVDVVLQALSEAELGSPSTPKQGREFGSTNPGIVRRYMDSEVPLRLAALLARYRRAVLAFLCRESAVLPEGGDAAGLLAASVVNRVFGHGPTPFARENEEFVEIVARGLGSDRTLCPILTGAAYSACYARYVAAGGKRGMFTNKFLAYVRALSSLGSNDAAQGVYLKTGAEICAGLGEEVLAPLESVVSLGIFRGLPWNPDSRKIYDAVHRFAIEAGVTFKDG
jgi:hypothetical protein